MPGPMMRPLALIWMGRFDTLSNGSDVTKLCLLQLFLFQKGHQFRHTLVILTILHLGRNLQ